MSKGRRILVGVGVFVLVLGVLYIDSSVYPFSTQKPNYADVERVFNRMQFPADWVEIRSSENRGIAGRSCPIESTSRCFQKGKIFKIPANTNIKIAETLLNSTGCPSVNIKDNNPTGGIPYTTYICSIEAVTVDGGFRKVDDRNWEASFYVVTD